jgi:Trk-type K+ transport system membrane component
MTRQPPVTPIRTVLAWIFAAAAGVAGLAMVIGLPQPVAAGNERLARILLVACLGLFALSRLLMLMPAKRLSERLSRWWVDYALLAAAIAWWIWEPARESFILRLAAVYVLAIGASSLFRAGIGSLAEGLPGRSAGSATRRLAGLALLLIVAGGAVLTLPACRRGSEAVEAGHTLAFYHLKLEFLDGTFTAASALTGTGLAVYDIGHHYSRVGQLVILVLMEVGGLGILSVATIIGLRFRRLLGWEPEDDDASPSRTRRAVALVCLLAIILQVVGAVGIYRMWDPVADSDFRGIQDERPLLAGFFRDRLQLGEHYDEGRALAAVFHAASSFTNCGLALSPRSYVAYRSHPGPLLALMPLMLLGSLGGPVLLDLLARMTRRRDLGLEALATDTWVTLAGLLGVLVAGAALLAAIEATRDLQARYPRDKTPGRLMVRDNTPARTPTTMPAIMGTASSPAPAYNGSAPIEFSAAKSERVRSERLSGMNWPDRIRAALFQAASALSGGSRTARVDEASLSPASHLVLMGLMLLGGGVGGTAGGLRIVIAWLLLGTVFTGGQPDAAGRGSPGRREPARAAGMAAGILAAMLLLIGVTSLVLIYGEAGSPFACLFEAVSAACNVGLSMGVTSELSIVGRITVILSMLIGRLIPLAILLRCFAVQPVPETRPAERPAPPPEDDDAPIPLE